MTAVVKRDGGKLVVMEFTGVESVSQLRDVLGYAGGGACQLVASCPKSKLSCAVSRLMRATDATK